MAIQIEAEMKKQPVAGVSVQIFDRELRGACLTGSDGRCFAGLRAGGHFLVIAKYLDVSIEENVSVGTFKVVKLKFKEK